MIFGLFRGRNNARVIDRLHAEVVAASREPVLFTSYGIVDDLDGRFESLALHAALVLRRLKDLQPPGPDVAQDLADAVFRYFDIGLREVGISDTGVPRRMRELAEAFLGRATAYNDALRQIGDARFATLSEALSRNVFGGREDGAELARYVVTLDKSFEQMPLVQFLEGPIFPAKAAVAAKEVPR